MAKSLRAKRGRAGRPAKRARPLGRFAALRGTRKSSMTTDEIMILLRGYEQDERDPGFKGGKK